MNREIYKELMIRSVMLVIMIIAIVVFTAVPVYAAPGQEETKLEELKVLVEGIEDGREYYGQVQYSIRTEGNCMEWTNVKLSSTVSENVIARYDYGHNEVVDIEDNIRDEGSYRLTISVKTEEEEVPYVLTYNFEVKDSFKRWDSTYKHEFILLMQGWRFYMSLVVIMCEILYVIVKFL